MELVQVSVIKILSFLVFLAITVNISGCGIELGKYPHTEKYYGDKLSRNESTDLVQSNKITEHKPHMIKESIYREKMRNLVKNISAYAKGRVANFIVIPQNAHELMIKRDRLAIDYVKAIDGVGRENLFFGYKKDNVKTKSKIYSEMIQFLNIAQENELPVLVIDYCWYEKYMRESYEKNFKEGFISFAADRRALDNIPKYPDPIFKENNNDITKLSHAKNFLLLLNPSNFGSREQFVQAVINTNYDVVIIDAFYYGDELLTEFEVESFKTKKNGGKRLVIAYLSIGEAEDYRHYWKDDWKTNKPDWIIEENPHWEGNYKVEFWNKEWQHLIFKGENSYLSKIINLGFDGVYLDLVDAYEFFEMR